MDFEVAQSPDFRPVEPPIQANLQSFEEASFHRWYNFILGYSDQVVGQIIDKFNIATDELVLDPFAGSGTTLVECAKFGIASIGIDANPFAVFAARAKSNFKLDPDALMNAAARVEVRYKDISSRRAALQNV